LLAADDVGLRAVEKLELQTPLGPIWLWGRASGRPTLLVVTGAFANFTVMDHFERVLPDRDVLRMHLPGNHCPRLTTTSIGAYAAALTDALGQAVSAPLVVLGISAGALVALGVRAPNLRGLLLIEPPIFTENLWPLAEGVDAAKDPDFMRAVFGIEDGRVVEPRDYSPLVSALAVPAEVLLGGVPLQPRRRFAKSPSLVDEPARATLASSPLVTTTVAAGAGHHIPAEAGEVFVGALQRLLARLDAAGPTSPPEEVDR
jgi:pimeloyl-ACP methyl ester carboxylesterase